MQLSYEMGRQSKGNTSMSDKLTVVEQKEVTFY